jgi:hypothetical protein
MGKNLSQGTYTLCGVLDSSAEQKITEQATLKSMIPASIFSIEREPHSTASVNSLPSSFAAPLFIFSHEHRALF